MRTRVLVAAATFVVAGAVAGCDRTTPGTVAMTTEAGPSSRTTTSSRPSTSSPRTSTPRTSTPRTSSNAPPGDALGVTCDQYVGLDETSRAGVIEEILRNESSVLNPGDAEIAKTLADAVCTFLPNSTVSEILLGKAPP